MTRSRRSISVTSRVTLLGMSKPDVTVWIRDGMFAERAGIEGWVPADTAIRASSAEALTELAADLADVEIVLQPTIMASGVSDVIASGEALLTGAGLASMAVALRVWLRRHDNKRVRIEYNGRTIDLTGMGTKDIEQVLTEITRLPDVANADANQLRQDEDDGDAAATSGND